MAHSTSAGVLARSVTMALVAGTLWVPAALAQTPFFTLVNTPPNASIVMGLSDDGRSVAGWKSGDRGFLWTAEAGRNDFGIGLPSTEARGISGDGRYVVGGGPPSSGASAFRWSAAGGYQNLGTLPGFAVAEAHDASFDGSVVVGTLETSTNGSPQAFRWTAGGGMQGLGFGTRAEAVSGDGNVIVGSLIDQPLAMRWTQAGGLQQLPSVGGTGASRARAVNFDGSIIVGNSGPGNLLLPTMWVNGSPTELLSAVPNSRLTPFGVSDTGSVVVGQVQTDVGQFFAGVWTQATGTMSLANYLTANGVSVPTGIVLESCTAVSADGLTFAGYTAQGSTGPQGLIGMQGWVATIPAPCPADLDNGSGSGTRDLAVTIDDLLFFLAAFESGNLAADLDNGSGTGTHDSAVTVEDLLYFLAHFEAGC